MKRLMILVLLCLFFLGGFFLFYREGSLPVDKNSKVSKIFVIRPGETLTGIANNLRDEKLIRNKVVFYFIVKKLGLEKKIQAGDFRLSEAMSSEEIAKNLTHGTLDVWLTLIEGLRKEEVAQIVSQSLNIPEIEFLKYAREGYLFPDTYLIPKTATAAGVVSILEENFNKRFDTNLRQKAKDRGLDLEDVLILASMIEREAKYAEDRVNVAGVLLRRLNSGMKLDIDATVQYALGYQSQEKSWWKKSLTYDDLRVDSAYNTYRNAGLPVGPIANPGLSAIEAVLDAPAESPYLYYVSDKTGHLHFAGSFAEHEANIRKYLR